MVSLFNPIEKVIVSSSTTKSIHAIDNKTMPSKKIKRLNMGLVKKGVWIFKKGLKVNPTLTQFPRERVMQFGGSNSTITYIIEVDQLVSLSRVIEPGGVLLSEGLPDWFVLRIQSHVGFVWSKSKMRWQKKLVVYFFAQRWLGARSSKERKVRREKQR